MSSTRVDPSGEGKRDEDLQQKLIHYHMYGIRERDVPYTVLNVRLCVWCIAQHTHNACNDGSVATLHYTHGVVWCVRYVSRFDCD